MRGEFAYLDNAATSWPKPDTVYAAVSACMTGVGANPGRSSHRMSVEAERLVDEARLLAARFFNAPSPSHVVFTLNCTDSLNMALKGLVRSGSRVVTGPFEHNSVVRPLKRMEAQGAVLRVARPEATGLGIDLADFERLCSEGVDVAVVAHASNVTGHVEPVAELAAVVHRHGGILVVDAAQTAGSVEIDLARSGIDVLAAPGHKGLMGPMGVGLLVFGRDLQMLPWREGGTGFKSEEETQPESLPWRLEAGTPNLPGIAGLAAGIRFIESEGIRAVAAKEAGLAARLVEGLAEIPGIRLYSDPSPRTGIVSFTIDSIDAPMAGIVLDQSFGIGVRAGLHCAPAAHRVLGTFPEGTLRASPGYFNTEEHVERLLAAVRRLAVG